ncbi:LuxR C-terminal-related transcriptional regulator [Nocardia sp. NBC_00565]|uniref:ATP-binding protein n=1 Tax=Nocardia sp. NBC_00565 TaxID=2975993 RepID=UPI002E81D6D8|nr:LuxR C-terminal-related transcriptional regulator [Nocardia sp. NBC_00565]WUC05134.1 LuxR C-terminal-related transcriptional regulator [Nocardia sp. NBC_00565]
MTSFVGRGAEVATARKLLSSTRLLTLTGPGGVGKTRLSRQVGETVRRAFPDGVWLVEVAHVHDGELVALSVAQTLGLRDDSSAPVVSLTDFLADKSLLLILDNCEHLIDACAALVDRLIPATTNVRILATSREPLGVSGEQVLPVAPLAVPEDSDQDARRPAGVDTDAFRLLVDRAAAANPDFQVTAANRGALAAICRRLDGIPLALELAALRLRMFTPDQVLARLDDAMRLLTTGLRTAPERQQTLEAAIGWSYDLCTPDEQYLWEQLSVFAGGFDLEAAEAVCMVDPPGALLDALTGLVDKSVLSYRQDSDGTGRYTMLEPLRQFALARLVARGGERMVRVRHRDHYHRVARRGRTAYWGSEDVTWFRDVTREHPNMRAALQFSLADPESAHRALEIATELRPFWEHYRFLLEGYRWLLEALDKDLDHTKDRARALAAASVIAAMLSDPETATRFAGECLEIATELDTEDVLAEHALLSALLAFAEEDPRRALDIAESASDRARACAHHGVEMESLAFAYVCALVLADERAGAIADRFLAETAEYGSHLLGGLGYWAVGTNHWRNGEQRKAIDDLRRAVELFRLFDRCVWTASGFDGLAWAAAADGDLHRAARLMGAASTVRRGSTQRLAHEMTEFVGDKVRLQVRDAMGEKEFRVTFESGAALGLDEAVDYALGNQPRPAAQPVKSTAADVLTRRERDVARLIAAGYSNKSIATELVISIRTAESHVEHILTKLGFTSRTQIAGWVSRHEL